MSLGHINRSLRVTRKIENAKLYTGFFVGKLPVNGCLTIIALFLPFLDFGFDVVWPGK